MAFVDNGDLGAVKSAKFRKNKQFQKFERKELKNKKVGTGDLA